MKLTLVPVSSSSHLHTGRTVENQRIEQRYVAAQLPGTGTSQVPVVVLPVDWYLYRYHSGTGTHRHSHQNKLKVHSSVAKELKEAQNPPTILRLVQFRFRREVQRDRFSSRLIGTPFGLLLYLFSLPL
jgi:hypothetical protein